MPAAVHYDAATIDRPQFLGGGQWHLASLLPFTVLFGKNGSGKSLLLRKWRDASVSAAHYVVPERMGAIGFQANYLPAQLSPQGRKDTSDRNSSGEYRTFVIARIQAYFQARGATRAGQLPGNVEDLEQLLAILNPDFEIKLDSANPPFRLNRPREETLITNVEELSSGEAQMLTVGLDIVTIAAIWDLQKTDKRLLLIDEPDAHIHPDLQVRFADFLVQVADKYNLQVVIATHSTTLLAAIGQFAGTRGSIVYLDRTKTDFSARPFTAELKDIAACLGGHALMGPLFGFPLLLVEGDDDYRIWSQVPRHHLTSFSVIACNGDEIRRYQRSLEQIFQSLREPGNGPAGYALLDGDKPLPQPSATTPQNHVEYLRLNCRESENLFLTNEVLQQLGFEWGQAAATISASSARHCNKGPRLAVAANWDRQQEDIKDVIAEVSLALDSKNVHWTQRVGVAIGQRRPTGQLADFLGQPVISALWPDR